MFLNGLQNFKRNTDRYCENFKEFAIKVKVNNQQLGEMWSEMSANFSGPSKKPQVLKEIPHIEQQEQEMYDDY